jgi:hypothetical protein
MVTSNGSCAAWKMGAGPMTIRPIVGTLVMLLAQALPGNPVRPTSWQRVTFTPIVVPGTDHEVMSVTVTQEVLVDTDMGPAYQPVGSSGKTEPAFLRFDLTWSSRSDASCRPAPMPKPIAEANDIHIALHRGDTTKRSNEPMGWIGVGNACSTTWALIAVFPAEPGGLDEAWFEMQAAGHTYWLELPYGLARNPSGGALDDPTRGSATLPSQLHALTETDTLVPWVAVRYELDRGASLEMIDACDGRARVTLDRTTSSETTIDSLPIAVAIHRADGQVLLGREIERSIRPRQSVFDFRRLAGGDAAGRTWDAVWVEIDGVRRTVVIPSSLFLLGHRLANWGDPHRIPVPDAACKD